MPVPIAIEVFNIIFDYFLIYFHSMEFVYCYQIKNCESAYTDKMPFEYFNEFSSNIDYLFKEGRLNYVGYTIYNSDNGKVITSSVKYYGT